MDTLTPRPPFVPSGIVFDLDGLLIDSEEAWGRAEEQVVRDLGHTWDPAVRAVLLGKGPEDAARALATFLDGGHDPADLDRRLLAAAHREFDAGLDARPGALALVEELAGEVGLTVATNSRRSLAERALEATGLAAHFSVVITCEDVVSPKPAPDPYLTACGLLGSEPATSVGLEDSPVGVASARAAGLWVIGCPSFPVAPGRASTALAQAHAVVGSLAHIDAGRLLSGVGAQEVAGSAFR